MPLDPQLAASLADLLGVALLAGAVGPRPARSRRVAVHGAAARRGRLAAEHRRGLGDPAPLPRAPHAGHPVRDRQLARGARARGRRRALARPVADGRDPRGQRRGPRLPRAGGRPPRGARSRARRARPAVRRRSRRRCDARRHGRDGRLGHDDGPLRQHARERARPRGGARRRHGDPHRLARAQVGGGLRPHRPTRRIGGHARGDHRAPAPRPRRARADRRRALLVPDDRASSSRP